MKLTKQIDCTLTYPQAGREIADEILPVGTYVIPTGSEEDNFGETITFLEASADGKTWYYYKTYETVETED